MDSYDCNRGLHSPTIVGLKIVSTVISNWPLIQIGSSGQKWSFIELFVRQ